MLPICRRWRKARGLSATTAHSCRWSARDHSRLLLAGWAAVLGRPAMPDREPVLIQERLRATVSLASDSLLLLPSSIVLALRFMGTNLAGDVPLARQLSAGNINLLGP